MEKRFEEIVGLRFYLAAWVAIGHGLQLAGFLVPTNPVLHFFLRNEDAVLIFMIISGFVITHLLLFAREAYLPYIFRRFFRLYPAFVLCCLAGWALAGPWADLVTRLPWHQVPGWDAYTKSVQFGAAQMQVNALQHVLAHATMLHGLIPGELLPLASGTMLPAAWSISLEWQFYLLAPLALALCRTGRGILALSVGSFLLFKAAQHGLFGHYQGRSMILLAVPYFALGIAGRLLFYKLAALKADPAIVSAVALVAIFTFVGNHLAIAIWVPFYCYLLWQRQGGWTSWLFGVLTRPKLMLQLGEASYSLYLLHRPIQVVMALALPDEWAANRWIMLAVQLLGVVVAAVASVAMYFAIERPFIQWAKRVTGGRATSESGSGRLLSRS